MRLIRRQRVPVPPAKTTDNPVWDQALLYYQIRYPRLMAHIAVVAKGTTTTLDGFPPVTVLTLGEIASIQDAKAELSIHLHYLTRLIRTHARLSSAPAKPKWDPPAGWSPSLKD